MKFTIALLLLSFSSFAYETQLLTKNVTCTGPYMMRDIENYPPGSVSVNLKYDPLFQDTDVTLKLGREAKKYATKFYSQKDQASYPETCSYGSGDVSIVFDCDTKEFLTAMVETSKGSFVHLNCQL